MGFARMDEVPSRAVTPGFARVRQVLRWIATLGFARVDEVLSWTVALGAALVDQMPSWTVTPGSAWAGRMLSWTVAPGSAWVGQASSSDRLLHPFPGRFGGLLCSPHRRRSDHGRRGEHGHDGVAQKAVAVQGDPCPLAACGRRARARCALACLAIRRSWLERGMPAWSRRPVSGMRHRDDLSRPLSSTPRDHRGADATRGGKVFARSSWSKGDSAGIELRRPILLDGGPIRK